MAEGDGGEVVVRLSQEGGEEIVAKLQEIIQKLGEVNEQSKKTSESTGKVGEAMKGIGTAAGITAIATGASAIMEFGKGAMEAAQKLADMSAQFIEAASQNEQLTIQIASLTEHVVGFNEALEQADRTLTGLKDLKILGDEEQLANTFRRLTLLVGGTSESITDLTRRMSLFAQQNGVTTESLLRVIQMAERTGTLPMRGQMAFASQALQRAGITGEQVKQAGEAITGGDTEAMDRLLQKVQVSKEATDALEGSWKNLGEQYERAKGEIVDIIGTGFEPLKEVLKEIIELLKSPEWRSWAKDFAGWVKDGLTEVISGLKDVKTEASLVWQSFRNMGQLVGGKMSFGQFLEAEGQVGQKWDAWDRSMAARNRASAVNRAVADIPNYESQWDESARVPVTTPPVPPDTAKQIEAARQRYDEFVARLQQQVDVSGLEGIDKSLAGIVAKADQSYRELDALEKRTPNAVSAAEDRAARDLIWEAKQKEVAEAVAQAWEKEEKQRLAIEESVTQTIDQMRRKSATDAIEIIQAQADAEIDAEARRVEKLRDQIDATAKMEIDLARAAVAAGEMDPATGEARIVAARRRALDQSKALDTAYAESSAAIQKKAADQKALLLDQEFGNYTDYYNRLMQKSSDAHENMFVAAQENAKKTADLMEKQAQTLEQGVAAGLAKIRAGMTSFGQDVASTFQSIWGDITKGFEEGFYDILTGKFDSLKDVLKSLWDSILKDFSKMLAQMLERWLLTGDAMGNGQGGGGFLSGLFGGGNQAVYTPGGTQANAPGGGFNQYGGDYIGTTGYGPNGQGYGGGGGGSTAGGVAAGAMIAYGLYQNFQDSKHNISTPTYEGVSLGQQDFGGNASFGRDFAPFATAALTLAATGYGAIVGVVVAAIGLIVAGLNSLFNGPKEGSVEIDVRDAWEKAGGGTGLGQFTKKVLDSSVNYMVDLMVVGGKGADAADFAAKYQAKLQDFFGKTYFKLSAGSGEDLSADVKAFYEKQFPKMALQIGFGQYGDKYGWPGGNRDLPGGFAGMDWNVSGTGINEYMDRDGKWIKQQLYDPDAPIPAFLAGIGFSQEKIAEIAQKLAGSTDINAFKTYLTDLVGVVVSFADLAKQFGRSRDEWYAFIKKSQDEQGTAAQFKEQIENLKAQGIELDNLTGDDRVAKAKQLVTDSTALLNNMGQALTSIYNMIDAIKESTAETIKSYQDKLKTPAQREAQARSDYEKDIGAIATAANPEQVQRAWQQVMKDLSAVLDAIVARINAIKDLQQSYADFRTQMAKDRGPQFATDPAAWLAQNQRDIDAVTKTLSDPKLSGDDAVTNAQKLLDLTKERYANEMQMLQQVNAAITAITEQGKQTTQNLQMQMMGHVETDPKTGAKKWVADTHAQGEFLAKQYDTLVGQLASAKTPEEVQRIYSQIQGILSQLAAQPQDPEHYAESRQKLIDMNEKATKAATDLLKRWGKTLEDDLSGTGDKLKAGEEALAKELDKSQKDFDKYIKLMGEAAELATDALNTFADGLIAAMQNLSKTILHWSWVMTHPDSEKDPNWDYQKNTPSGGYTAPPETDKWEDDPTEDGWEICVAGPHKGKRRRKSGWHAPPSTSTSPNTSPPSSTTASRPASDNGVVGPSSSSASKTPATDGTNGPPTSADYEKMRQAMVDLAKKAGISVEVNVNAGTPEEIARAAADAVYDQTVEMIKQNNVALTRAIRQNPVLISPAPGRTATV